MPIMARKTLELSLSNPGRMGERWVAGWKRQPYAHVGSRDPHVRAGLLLLEVFQGAFVPVAEEVGLG